MIRREDSKDGKGRRSGEGRADGKAVQAGKVGKAGNKMERLSVLLADHEKSINEFAYYVMALKDLGIWDVRLSLNPEKAEDADGIILPGSYNDINPALWGEDVNGALRIDDSLDDGQRKIMDLAVEKHIPVLGICRGIQYLNVYFGGSIIQDLRSASAHTARTPDRYHRIHTTPGSFMEELYGESLMVNTRHHQAAGSRVGEGLQVAARWVCEEDGWEKADREKADWEKEVIDVLVHETLPITGLQWHPEKMMYLGLTAEHKETGQKMMEYFIGQVEAYHETK